MRFAVGLMIAVFVAVLATAAISQDMSKVANTPHNLNTVDVWGVVIPQNRVCLPCHTPHNAESDDDGKSMVLWNHAITDQTFEVYTTTAGHDGGQVLVHQVYLFC